MLRKNAIVSRIKNISKPVSDQQKQICDQIFNCHSESRCSGPRVADQNLTAFMETPRDSLHSLNEQEFSPAAPLSSDGSSITPRESHTPEELRAILISSLKSNMLATNNIFVLFLFRLMFTGLLLFVVVEK